MICGGCGEKNRDGARFCLFCGDSLAVRCGVCDNELPAGARFCDSCGTPVDEAVAAVAPVAATRKVVTVLFADLTGSTALEERLDAETVKPMIDRFYSTLRTETERHGGRVVKFTGDGVMSVFGLPDVREDDAARALDAALAMRNECAQLSADLGIELAIKVGVNTGEVVASETDEDVVGDCVNVAARLEGVAPSGEIYVGEETWRLTRSTSRFAPVPPLTLKGKSDPVTAYRLLSVDERTADSAAAPFVGRDRELGRMLATFEDAVASRSARLITIIGSPGLGKTRLARELMSRLERNAQVREARCDPADSTFAPIADTLRGIAQIADAASGDEVVAAFQAMIAPDDPDRDRIASRAAAILGVGLPGTTEETFWALRRLIESAAQAAPVVLVIDDLHWAEPLLLDLVEHLAEWVKDAPVVIVGTGRPELRDLRPSLGEGGHAAVVIALEGLDDESTARLALNLLGADELPADLLLKIPASTQGNPLFVRELVRMLVDDGVLLRGPGGWRVTVDVDAIQVPPTIQSLLAARVDRLRPDERTFIELAAVVGKEFYPGALHELAPAVVREHLDGCLESLRRKELIEPSGAYWIDEPVYHFHHALIRDAAYRRVLKEMRADVHERVAQWLEDKTRDVLGEHDELIGYHFEQAHEYRSQLGRQDERIARRAADLLGAAAQRALDRDDLPAAASLSGRALARVPHEDPSRAELLLLRCEALLSIGDVTKGALAVVELGAAADTPRLEAWAVCFRGQLANLSSPDLLHETRSSVAAAAVRLTELGDAAGAAKAHTVHAATLARLGRFGECEAVLDAGLNAAREANDRRRITAVLGSAPHATLWGPSPVSRAGGRCLDIIRLLRITTGSLAVEASSNRCQAVLEAFRGRSDAARKMLRNSRRPLVELGLDHEMLEADLFAGIIELVSGDPAASLSFLQSAYDGFAAEGVDVLAAQSAAVLARAHLALGEEADAERFAAASEALGGLDLKASIAWRAVKAELLARQGDTTEARRLAEAAVDAASETDALIDHGDALLALAVVCAAAGDAAAARSAEERARSLYERKGATALMSEAPAALPRDDSVRTPAPSSVVRPNAASLAVDREQGAYARRDWDAYERFLAPDVAVVDRRVGFSFTSESRADYVVGGQELAALDAVVTIEATLATRGDRLVLQRFHYLGATSGFEVSLLALTEIDELGRLTARVLFDVDAFGDAVAELDARFMAFDEHADVWRSVLGAVNTYDHQDWGAFAAAFSDDLLVVDHRPAYLGTITSREELTASLRVQSDLVSGLRVCARSIEAISGGAVLYTPVVTGRSADGAEIEISFLQLAVVRGDLIVRLEFFPLASADEARRRFAEMSDVLENAATRLAQRLVDAAGHQDEDPSLHAPDARIEDRRTGLRNDVIGREAVLAHDRELQRFGVSSFTFEPIAIRGDRLAVGRFVCSDDSDVGFRVEVLGLIEVDEAGRLLLSANFDPDDLDGVYELLDELAARPETAPSNMASRVAAAFFEVINRGDIEGTLELNHPDVVVDDRRPGLRVRIEGRDAALVNLRNATGGGPRIEWEILATRGDHLVLTLTRWIGTRPSDYVVELSNLFEVDDRGLVTACVQFEGTTLDEAYAELDRRFAAAEGTTCTRQTDRFLQLVNDGHVDAAFRLCHAGIILEDRRPGLSSRVEGYDAVLENMSISMSVRPTIGWEYLATRGERLVLVRQRWTGTVPAEFEAEILCVFEVNTEGLFTAVVQFEPGAVDIAIAELDRRAEALQSDVAVATNAVAVGRRLHEAFDRQDWDAFGALLAPDSLLEDRRKGFGGFRIQGREVRVENMRAIVRVGGGDIATSTVATRGERLVLTQFVVGVRTDFHTEFFQLDEYAEDGSLAVSVLYDLDDLDAAFEDLDRRFADDVGPDEADMIAVGARILDAWNRRDWEGFMSNLAPDVVYVDHRPASSPEASGPGALRDLAKQSVELVPDVRHYATSYIAVEPPVACVACTARGTNPEGGTVVFDYLQVATVRDGLGTRIERFEIDDLEHALARLEELRAEIQPLENAATRAKREGCSRLLAGDFEAYRNWLAEDVVLVDRRPGLRGVMRGRGEAVSLAQVLVNLGVDRIDATPLAVRGERLALHRVVLASSRDGGFDVVVINVDEIDSRGAYKTLVAFEPEDLDAAFEELDARWLADPEIPRSARVTLELITAYNARDWGRYRSLLADDVVMTDSQLLVGAWTSSADELLAFMRPLVELAPDIRLEVVRDVRVDDRRGIAHIRQTGTSLDGGSFALEYLSVGVLDLSGRFERIEMFDEHDVDRAIARYEELATAALAVPTRPSNACTRASDRSLDAFERRDWPEMAGYFNPDWYLEDRRQGLGARIEGLEVGMQNVRMVAEIGVARFEVTYIAVRGERLSLSRRTTIGAPGTADFHASFLSLAELDEEGRICANVAFDPDDLDAAFAELDARFAAGEGASARVPIELNTRLLHALNVRDVDTVRDLLARDLRYEDHRPLGASVTGRDEFTGAVVALTDLSPDIRYELVEVLAFSPDVAVGRTAAHGTNADGGSVDFAYLQVVEVSDGLVVNLERYDPDQLLLALARFEELTSEPPLMNASVRAKRRSDEAFLDGRVDDFLEYFTDDCFFADRRLGLRGETVGKPDVRAVQTLIELGVQRVDVEPVATRGERVALVHRRYRTQEEGGFEVELLNVVQVTEVGKIEADIVFDLNDLEGAFAELDERYLAGEGASLAEAAAIAMRFTHGVNHQDWDAVRGLFAPDAVTVDHRPASLGEVTVDEWITSMAALLDLVETYHAAICRDVVVSGHRAVLEALVTGTAKDGGNFETKYLAVVALDDGLISCFEAFPLGSIDRAMDRFRELAPRI